MPAYVEIAVNVPQVSGLFDYHLPPELEGLVKPGHLVEVPFAHQTVQESSSGRFHRLRYQKPARFTV
jgi:hypothetical protein